MAHLLSTFPNLEYLNCENNPLSAKNLNKLTSEQFNKLVKGIKDKKIKINSWKGTILIDLLEYAQQLIKQGKNTENAYKLQAILQNSSIEPNKGENNSKSTPLVIGGIILVGLALVGIGYLLGKKRKNNYE